MEEKKKNAIIERVNNAIKEAINADYRKLYELCGTERSNYDKYWMTKIQMDWFEAEVINDGILAQLWSLSDFDSERVEAMYEEYGGHGYAKDADVLYALVSEHGNYISKLEVVDVTTEILDENIYSYYVAGTIKVKVNDLGTYDLYYADWNYNINIIKLITK